MAAIKCCFCEQPLVCKACGKPFHPRTDSLHQGVYQPDTQVACPECQKLLACKACGFIYGGTEEDDE
jgi:hypothetical protein